MRRALALAATALALATAAGPAAADARHGVGHHSRGHEGGGGRTYAVSGTEADPDGISPDGAGCSIADGGCRINFTGHVTYVGGISGTAAYVLHMNPVPASDGNHYTGHEHFPRVTLPCGTGSLDVDLAGVYETTTIDVPTHTTTLVEHGILREGTGELQGVSGWFTTTVHDHNDTTTDGSYQGAVTCPNH